MFCCDTGCPTNIMPVRLAAKNDLKWYAVDKDEPSYKSVTSQSLEVIGQTQCFVKLEKVRNSVKLSFIVVMDDSDESLLSLDTLKNLSIVPKDFPNPMNPAMRDNRVRRVIEEEEEENLMTKFTLQERVDHLTEQLRPDRVNERDLEDEAKCEAMKQSWLTDFSDVFEEDLSQEDRINMDPVNAILIPNHEDIERFHPKVVNEVPAYLQHAAEKEIRRMLDGGLLEEVR